ncbi:MAG: rhomboid family intramembrane serine protease, partial [Planctomycetota bacterium]
MGLYDRDYSQSGNRAGFGNAPQMRMSFPKLTLMVKRLLIINVAVFFTGILIKPVGFFLYEWFQIDASSLSRAMQLWRLITYQFLHSPIEFLHIVFNMLMLYFLGPVLERHWGSK